MQMQSPTHLYSIHILFPWDPEAPTQFCKQNN
uniref:Uncharacterized protein n=1 Tax=Arundo donax TaxID=35708 RepID=A0A0A9FYQ0_ARUDO